jgi:hypothetical protein
MRPPKSDDTIRVLPEARRRQPAWLIIAAALVVVLLVGGSAVFLTFRPSHEAAVTPPIQSPVTAFAIQVASEEAIRDHIATDLTIFRFADNPRILVLDFASLREQGRMLNRVAALEEKSELPHDRVLADTELSAAIQAKGDTVETFYFGHDYSAAGLARFFVLADGQHLELDGQEERLRALLRQEGWLTPGTVAGLISLPAVGSDPRITIGARAAILRHELAHGEFFSNPAYADYVRGFWRHELAGEERGAIRGFLGREGYDVREEELMLNEMQAYLMFTRDPLFFSPDLVQISPARLADLQARFLAGMPEGWLRNALAEFRSTASAK